ncbi:hypothetical protein I306_05195 [Cryptococcus gattii EJB2]|uniref:Uncharacterized protein n=1 Tax=Cryptococcus gattii EJB2 TaxID=1296103 RepID=A0ABR5BQ78_9TREE|nr:hypothetical protein I306_05195 [Cryptococcus gattii EJB2]
MNALHIPDIQSFQLQQPSLLPPISSPKLLLCLPLVFILLVLSIVLLLMFLFTLTLVAYTVNVTIQKRALEVGTAWEVDASSSVLADLLLTTLA